MFLRARCVWKIFFIPFSYFHRRKKQGDMNGVKGGGGSLPSNVYQTIKNTSPVLSYIIKDEK